MSTRKPKLSLLYAIEAPSHWLRTVTATVTRNAAALCQSQWQSAYIPAAMPQVARRHSH